MTLPGMFKGFVRWEGALVVVLVVEVFVFGALNPRFLDAGRLLGSTTDFVYLGIVALPLAIVMMTGGIDISIGSIISLSAIVTGVSFASGVPIWVAVAMALSAAALAGLFNGTAIVLTGASPMVITLGTQFLFAGVALGLSGLAHVSTYEGVSGLPDSFVGLSNGRSLGVPNMLWVFVLAAAVFGFLLHRTTFGRQARLIGANRNAAVYTGLAVTRTTVTAYVLSALGAGVVGVMLTSYLASARADVGRSALLPVLTLVVIGGVSMFGGEGTAAGVVIATFVVGFLQQGLRFAGLSESEVAVATGTALVLVASLRWWTSHATESVRNRRTRLRQAPEPGAGEPRADPRSEPVAGQVRPVVK
jgi:AI-2 transport system permease protein